MWVQCGLSSTHFTVNIRNGIMVGQGLNVGSWLESRLCRGGGMGQQRGDGSARLNKPAAQAVGADPSGCNSTNRQNPPLELNGRQL